jgi:hypothetical protein
VGYKCIQKKAWDGKKLSIIILLWKIVSRYAKNPIANDWVLPMIGQLRYLRKSYGKMNFLLFDFFCFVYNGGKFEKKDFDFNFLLIFSYQIC